mgnify:CR=1 FL=1
MGNELISIVVPIYNVENYLRMCLDSILGQTYEHFECLLINDGSPDNSADICREYVAKDARFRYFEKENGGVASARNLGIKRSEGAYITFIDSDDWVDSDYLEVLYNSLLEEDADISVSTYKQFNTKENCWYLHSSQRGYEKRIFTNQELIDEFIDLNTFDYSYGFVCGKLVRKALSDNIAFNEMTTLGEDMEYWLKLYLISNKVVYVNRDSYIYRVDNVNRYFESEKIRSDIQQRLNFIAFLAIRGIDISKYVNSCLYIIKYRVEKLKDLPEYDASETVRWLHEVMFLLEEKSEL